MYTFAAPYSPSPSKLGRLGRGLPKPNISNSRRVCGSANPWFLEVGFRELNPTYRKGTVKQIQSLSDQQIGSLSDRFLELKTIEDLQNCLEKMQPEKQPLNEPENNS